jgi:outer membrane protein assembly factor BamA
MEEQFGEIERSYFTHEQRYGEFHLGKIVSRHSKLKLFARYEINSIEDGKESPRALIQFPIIHFPGAEQDVNLLSTRAEFEYNNMNHPGIPSRGIELDIDGGYYVQTNSHNYEFFKYNFDFKKYIHLFYQRVLVLRLAGEFSELVDNRNIPFYYLSEIGKAGTVRGFRRGRFRDDKALWATLEYRAPLRYIWSKSGVDFIAFADVGDVSAEYHDFELDKTVRSGVGFGLRFWNLGGETGRLEYGFSNDGFRVYLVIGL